MAQMRHIGPGDHPVTVDEVLAAIDQLLAGHAEAPDALTVPGALGIVRGLVAAMPPGAGSVAADGPDAVVLPLPVTRHT